jgi:uncharacterized integral membrane protein
MSARRDGGGDMIIISYAVATFALFWVGMVAVFLGGLILVILALVLAVLKVAGIFVWSWSWVLLPLGVALFGNVTWGVLFLLLPGIFRFASAR